tara:strand:- start:121 stop:546 length:426 start_codon:yes stop_codon:yes gene_type:complete
MKEQLITFNTAKLAKEKGFNWGCNYFYTPDKKPYITRGYEYRSDAYVEDHNWNAGMGSYPTKASDVLCSAPTQSLLQKWLREEHKINVESNYLPNIQKYSCLYIPMRGKACISDRKYVSKLKFDTYEEALEEGLQEALKLI